jgi:hypothetical protein
MKPTDFIPEKHHIGRAAMDMHVDHEIQMARENCYNAATNAIELHRMLKKVSEQEGLDAWASEKLSLANDYLRTVKEWLEYEIINKLETQMSEETFDTQVVEFASAAAGAVGSIATAPAAAGELFGGKKKKARTK